MTDLHCDICRFFKVDPGVDAQAVCLRYPPIVYGAAQQGFPPNVTMMAQFGYPVIRPQNPACGEFMKRDQGKGKKK